MKTYRLYPLNADGRVADRIEVDALNDLAALSAAHLLDHLYGVTVWLDDRHIGDIPARDG